MPGAYGHHVPSLTLVVVHPEISDLYQNLAVFQTHVHGRTNLRRGLETQTHLSEEYVCGTCLHLLETPKTSEDLLRPSPDLDQTPVLGDEAENHDQIPVHIQLNHNTQVNFLSIFLFKMSHVFF